MFGSNLNGWHGGGAARTALLHFGAEWGKGEGPQGRSYAIPTMQGGVETIAPYVERFIRYAQRHPERIFLVTPIGCGIAGFSPSEIAPLFREAVDVENIQTGLFEDYINTVSLWNTYSVRLEESAMTVTFPTYALGPYALGTLSFSLPYNELSNALGSGGMAKLGIGVG